MSIKRSRPRRASQKDVPRLKRKLWSLLSVAVKQKYGNRCYSCGRGNLSGSGWHAGHLFPAGSHNSIRFCEGNLRPQCYNCNINLGGNGAAYAARYISENGSGAFEALLVASRIMKQWKAWELEILIEKIGISLDHYAGYYEETYGPKLELSVVKK